MNLVYLLVGVALGFALGAVAPKRDECPDFLRQWWKSTSKKVDKGASVTMILSVSDKPIIEIEEASDAPMEQWRYN